jgi:hypothetical protein
MRLFNLFPWRFVLRRIARRKGFLDPLDLLARLRRFSQPSEVQEPIELIRAGMVFHARGLVNTKVIQHNLDWIWPYWIVRQFSPGDTSFIPRAFSFSHVNLTHRNWTALGVPGSLEMPIVDPRGMITPRHDDWSVDHWFIADDGHALFPSRLVGADQRLLLEDGHAVQTDCRNEVARLLLRSEVRWHDGQAVLETEALVGASRAGRFVVSVRPCNPEGVQFIERVEFTQQGSLLEVDGRGQLRFESPPEAVFASDYRHGDVLRHVRAGNESTATDCEAGLATAAAAYRLREGQQAVFRYRIPLVPEEPGTLLHPAPKLAPPSTWKACMEGWARLESPDSRFVEIFESSKRTLALLSQSEILPGPYTYRRFWFRDACLIGNALLGLGRDDRVRQALDYFHHRQRLSGYFHSQEGEWDSNGQVLWLANRYEELSGRAGEALRTRDLLRAARWIDRKRRKTLGETGAHKGLLPAGFSAEHLGPNDYYYWDDFWGAAGLRSAEALLERRGRGGEAAAAGGMADAFEADILASLGKLDPARIGRAIPAAPSRRMDAGAIGSMVADYPLRLDWVPAERLLATAEWLHDNCLHHGGFFQDMIHSGINAYLTLDLARSFLRFEDPRYWELIRATAAVASPTGKWPEAVHPLTGGGCMGDGEHAWAAAEWCETMRALFIDESDDGLAIGGGLPAEWLEQEAPLAYGPTLTRWGKVVIRMEKAGGRWRVILDAAWRDGAPAIRVCLPERFPHDAGITTRALA